MIAPRFVMLRIAFVVCAASTLLACGGGSSNSAAGPASAVIVSSAGALSFSGSAATGAAIANAAVDVKCLGGATANATTSSMGNYRVTLPQSVRLPCVVRVAASGGALHAAVDTSYVSGEVNITPLTDLTLARSGRVAAASLFAALGATSPNGLSAASLNVAQGDVINTFRPLINLSGVRSFVQDALVPAVAGVRGGNALDQQLDELNAKLIARNSNYNLVLTTLLAAASGDAAAALLWPSQSVQGPVAVIPPVSPPAPSAVLSASTNSIAFGAQLISTSSSNRSVTLANVGTTAFTVSSISINGTNGGSFVRSNASTCTNTSVLAANETCTYSVVFQSGSAGEKTAALTIVHNAGGANSTLAISLSGTSQVGAPTVAQQVATDAISAAAMAKAAVQNFVALTYSAFTTLADLGVRDSLPVSSVSAAPASSVNVSNRKNWSDTVTWSGSLPTDGASVVIPTGTTIVLDTNTANLGALTINGTLEFARQNVALTAANITISNTGAMLIGSVANPFANKATITLTGARPAFPNPATATNRIITNTRGITVNGGTLELHGVSPSPVWTQINDNAAAGTKSLSLKQTVNWAAGSKIIVGPTDYYGVNPTETLTLASTASSGNLSTTTALSKFRWGKMQYMTDNGLSVNPGTYTPPVTPAPTQLDQRAAVGNLSRNIVIQGANDSAWTTYGFGAHVMVMDMASKVFVDGVEFNRVGQAGAMGRYPFHWHMLSYDLITGNYLGQATGHEIRNSTISESAQRCIVVHGTTGVRVVNNICHDIKGHAIFLEDGVERKNTFEGNLVLKLRQPSAGDLILQHEGNPFLGGPSGFWITNPNNTVRNNVVGDAQGNGYWNSFPTSGVGLSRKAVNPDLAGTQWATLQMNPRNMPHISASFAGVFDNNVAYSTGQAGINTDVMLGGGGVVGDDLGNTGPDTWRPTFDGRPYDINGVGPSGGTGSVNVRSTFSRSTIYKTNAGYHNRIGAPDYPEWVMADVAGVYARGAGNDGAFFRGLFIGKSLNDKVGGVDTYPPRADKQSFFATYHSTFQMRDNTFAHIGYEEMPGDVERTESGVFKSDDYYIEQLERGTILNANNKFVQAFAGARSMSANLLTINQSVIGRADLTVNYALAGAIWDPYGYWGNKGSYWTFDTPFYTSGGGCEPSQFPTGDGKNSAGKYNGQSCAGEFYGVSYQRDTDFMAESSGVNTAFWPVDIERVDCNPALYNSASWGTAARACRQVVGSGWNSWKLGNMRGASLRQGGKYVMRFPNPALQTSTNGGSTPIFISGIAQGTMVNTEGQTVVTTIPKVVSLMFTNLSRETDSFVFGVSFDGTKNPVGVVGVTPDSGKRFQWALPPNSNGGLTGPSEKYRVLAAAASLAEVEADTTGTKMWQDRTNNLVYVKMKGGFPPNPWYRIVNFTAPYGQDLYKSVGLYIKDSTIPNQ